MKKKGVILFLICAAVIAGVVISVWRLGFKLSLERHIIPAYPEKYASLREVLNYYTNELNEQGMNVQIQILDDTRCDETRLVRGLAGNGYLFMFGISDVFDTEFKCARGHMIIVNGVGSKRAKDSPSRERSEIGN